MTKQLLNAGRGHQAPRKADQCLPKQVRKNIKDEKETKEVGRELHPGKGIPFWEGNFKRGFQTPRNILPAESVVSFGSTEGNVAGRKYK